MKLYYYTKFEYGLQALRDQRIKVARIKELNDPFELQHFQMQAKNWKPLTAFREEMHSNFGLICMSSDCEQPLLWSHYADKHKGICLEFDAEVSISAFQKVQYKKNRVAPTHQELKVDVLGSTVTNVGAGKLIYTKFDGWDYEKEYRDVVLLFQMVYDPVTDHYFKPFSTAMQLTRVLIGSLAEGTVTKVKQVLEYSKQDSVMVVKTRPAHLSFRVVEVGPSTKKAAKKRTHSRKTVKKRNKNAPRKK